MIFDEQIARKPDHYPWTKDFINAMWKGHWTPNEFNFKSDIQDFETALSQEEKEVITRALSAIGQIEIAVKTFWAKLGDNLPHPSIRDMGYVFASIEVTHNYAYEKLLSSLGMEDVFNENLKLDFINGRVNYLRKYTHKYYNNNRKQFIYSLILFTLFVENVSLFSQFYIINWFGKKNLLKDTNQQTTYTLKEELIHALGGIKLINTIREEHPDLFDKELEDRVKHEADEAVKSECKIIDWMVNGIDRNLLSAPILKEFVKNRMNDSLIQIGYSPVFEIDKDLIKKTRWFDENILANGHTDFFFARPVDYVKSGQPFSADDLF